MMRTVAFVEWLLMDAALTVRCLAMIVLLCGDSVHTVSTCTAYLSGLILNKFNSTVQCADRNGSSKSDSGKIPPPPPASFGSHGFTKLVEIHPFVSPEYYRYILSCQNY